ncbi:hypothetical protein F8388_017163 [Cannabis sativa]|uniref:Uncharacterized protein n=1 Tax=Cannabis sativa TaxID=3483 RepID=A0A7J6GFC1_CANSA|nr:hypothetical protein F8388_017163 [Cannabis sativa]
MSRKVVIPERGSASFKSVIANLEWRVRLDPSIKHGDPRYNAALSIMASKISYENQPFIQNVLTHNWKGSYG